VVDGEAARPIDSTIQAARTAADDIVERLVELAEQRGDDLYEVGGSVVGSVE
jgi:H2-forming N5,N10-methylenetetrahydromethanopterin dehydrogenase-like enzyme